MALTTQIQELAATACVGLSTIPSDVEFGAAAIVLYLEHLALARRALLSSRNDHQPVNRLLPELLVDIFSRYDEWHADLLPMPWRKLRLVCRYWNELILATPTLWRTITIEPKATAWLDLCLRNSCEATVDVKFRCNDDANPAVRHLLPHAQRLRSLHFGYGYGHRRKQLVRMLQDLFGNRELPVLEDLQCLVVGSRYGKVDLKLSSQRCPRIQKLSLGNVHLPPETSSILCKLRKLSLTECSTDLTFDQFLAALASCPCLEHLHLSGFLEGILPRRGSSNTTSASRRIPIVLAHLHDIYITDDPPAAILALLQTLHLPANIRVILTGRIEEDEELVVAGGLTSFLPSQSLRLTALPVLASSAITRATVDVMGNFEISAGADPYNISPNIELALYSPQRLISDNFLPLALRNLVDVLSAAPLRELNVIGTQDTVSVALWISVLTAFPLLESIATIGGESVSSLWSALSWGLDDTTTITDASILCPHLSCVDHQGSVLASHALYGDILDSLRRRRTKGAYLRSLILGPWHDSKDAYDEMCAEYLPQLQALVEEVHFGGDYPQR
ncbi:hypothetical protein C8Q73DRAFT_789477 [Cubamyces lactineus]|nr:hypothetical protein C8Q73DRAFT_789477 [Cubamyces lactineus]